MSYSKNTRVMKTLSQLCKVVAVITLLIAGTSATPPKRTDSVRGAASRSELSEALSQAIKSNNFDQLLNYLPDDHHLDILREKSPEIEKNVYENLDAETVKIRTKENFENIIQAGIIKGIHWESLNLLSNNASKNSNSLRRMDTVTLQMEDNKELRFSVSFDAMMIAERWFLFQGIRVTTEEKEIGYAE